jgi:hypothetical protein
VTTVVVFVFSAATVKDSGNMIRIQGEKSRKLVSAWSRTPFPIGLS